MFISQIKLAKKLGKGNVYKIWSIIYIFNILGLILAFTSRDHLWLAALTISATYGASFAIQPSLLADFYGRRIVSKAYPMLLTAWAGAGLCGNQIAETMYKNGDGNNISSILFIIGIIYIVGLILSLILKWVYNLESEKLNNKHEDIVN